MGNDLVVHADIGCDHGRAHAHVLQNLVTALSPCPDRVPKRHDADVESGQVRLFGFQTPRLVLDMNPIELKRFIGNHFQF